jgi:4'-phosphopantetheinyl transferase
MSLLNQTSNFTVHTPDTHMGHLHSFWSVLSVVPTLVEGEVHIWRARLDPSPTRVRRLVQTLCQEERSRARKFVFARDKDRFVVRRGILREILGGYLAVPADRLQFHYDRYGKPRLVEPSGDNTLRFNLSHSDTLAVFALTRGRRIGVDLERVRTDIAWHDLTAQLFTEREATWLQPLAGPQRHRASLVAWTCKEAYVKARGHGLSFPMNQVEISFAPLRLRRVGDDGGEASRWTLQELPVGDEYVAALVVEGDAGTLRCWEWR